MDISKLKEDKEGASFLKKLESSEKFKVVKIGAEWCSPCVRLKPYFKSSEKENINIDFHEIDLGKRGEIKNKAIAEYFQVYGIPYVVLLSPENKILKKAEDTFHFMDEFKDIINGKTAMDAI